MTTVTASGTARAAAVTANGKHRTIATVDLGRRLRRSEAFVEELLNESETMGLVERGGNGWRLSAEGERRFGRAFRALSLPSDPLPDETAA